jgi:hypothetical protein
MNIFVLDECPVNAARMQCDKHVVKMVLESGQMLSTAHRLLDGTLTITQSNGRKKKVWNLQDRIMEATLYKVAHPSHPCTLWTMESEANYLWHYKHFLALCEEYKYRYGKVHLTDSKLRNLLSKAPNNIPKSGLTQFRLAMGSNPECIDIDNPIESYRKFYKTKQERFKMIWSKRDIPNWFNNGVDNADVYV